MKTTLILVLLALAITSCQSSPPQVSKPPAPPLLRNATAAQRSEGNPSDQFLRRNDAPPLLPTVRLNPTLDFRLNQIEPPRPPEVQAPAWKEPKPTGQSPSLLLRSYPTIPNLSAPTSRTLPLRIPYSENPSLPQTDFKLALSKPLTAESLRFQPEGAKLRPRSPYCMPGHTSQNFVLYSVHDGPPSPRRLVNAEEDRTRFITPRYENPRPHTDFLHANSSSRPRRFSLQDRHHQAG